MPATAAVPISHIFLLRRRQILHLLRISAPALERLVAAAEIAVVRLRPGRRAIRIPRESLLEFIRRRNERRGQRLFRQPLPPLGDALVGKGLEVFN